MLFRLIAAPVVSAILLLCVACDEQQVLYTTKAEEPIPPVPERPTAVVATPAGGAAAAQPATLGTPTALAVAGLPKAEGFQAGDFAGVKLALPPRYELVPNESTMRLGTYRIPNASGGAAGELVIYSFGVGQGGSMAENVQRWYRQFTPLENSQTALASWETGTSADGLTLTQVSMEGTWSAPAMGPMAPAQPPRPAYSMIGLIIEGGSGGSLFLRMTGPVELMRSEKETALAILGSAIKAPAAAAE